MAANDQGRHVRGSIMQRCGNAGAGTGCLCYSPQGDDKRVVLLNRQFRKRIGYRRDSRCRSRWPLAYPEAEERERLAALLASTPGAGCPGVGRGRAAGGTHSLQGWRDPNLPGPCRLPRRADPESVRRTDRTAPGVVAAGRKATVLYRAL
ncbi:hypothetical protein DSL92_06430 [Billgrantia gudaonensis]|uniref:Uncharacterized protein n=1 Tax=Billgrantia gudaonensis TaxID=376427 RepID=A0A432JIL9_9GAMM|nr:hypothetical protein DSL92_06430 [Halomonas gudaonensis]